MTDLTQKISRVRPVTIRDRVSIVRAGLPVVESAARAMKGYCVAHELLINFSNMEYLIDEKLQDHGVVSTSDLPLDSKYASRCLQLYQLGHRSETVLDKDTGRLTSSSGVAVR
jgi:hypothetical protein